MPRKRARRADRSPLQHPEAEPRLRGDRDRADYLFIGMVVEDYSRGWKRSSARSCGSTRRRRAKPRSRPGRQRSARSARSCGTSCRLANQELAAHRRSSRGSTRKLKDLAPRIYLADQQFKFTKASLDAQRYRYENALATAPKSGPKEKRGLDELEKELETRRLHLAQLQKEETDAKAARERLVARREAVQTSFQKLTADYSDLAQAARESARGHGFQAPQLADPRHGEPVAPGPAGPAPRPLHQRQLHEDSRGSTAARRVTSARTARVSTTRS